MRPIYVCAGEFDQSVIPPTSRPTGKRRCALCRGWAAWSWLGQGWAVLGWAVPGSEVTALDTFPPDPQGPDRDRVRGQGLERGQGRTARQALVLALKT